jgi:hypothetical protein
MIDWLLSTLWYGSFVSLLVAVLGLVRPIRWLGLPTRRRAFAVGAGALLLVAANAAWTPGTEVVFLPQSSLDSVAPAYHFHEKHSLVVHAAPARVMRAIKAVPADEIVFFQMFTAVRRFGRPGPESLLNAPPGKPVMEVATRTGFILLTEDAREVVLGAVLIAADPTARERTRDARGFRELDGPGLIKTALNFRIEETHDGASLLTTETRVFCSDRESLRRFTRYWRTIFPGSWILRATWLRAIGRRAEKENQDTSTSILPDRPVTPSLISYTVID